MPKLGPRSPRPPSCTEGSVSSGQKPKFSDAFVKKRWTKLWILGGLGLIETFAATALSVDLWHISDTVREQLGVSEN